MSGETSNTRSDLTRARYLRTQIIVVYLLRSQPGSQNEQRNGNGWMMPIRLSFGIASRKICRVAWTEIGSEKQRRFRER